MTFDIAMGVRRADKALKAEVDSALVVTRPTDPNDPCVLRHPCCVGAFDRKLPLVPSDNRTRFTGSAGFAGGARSPAEIRDLIADRKGLAPNRDATPSPLVTPQQR